MPAMLMAVSFILAYLLPLVSCKPGDVILNVNFVQQNWSVYMPNGTQNPYTLELNARDNAIKMKDACNCSWWFQTPQGSLNKFKESGYNSTLRFSIQSLEWSGAFIDDYDVILIPNKRLPNIGIRGVRDGSLMSGVYDVQINEYQQWQMIPKVNRYGKITTPINYVVATKFDVMQTLSNIEFIQIRGGYYSGTEKTQLSLFQMIEGDLPSTGSQSSPGTATSSSLDSIFHEVGQTSALRYELEFNRPGLECATFLALSQGNLRSAYWDANSHTWNMKLDLFTSADAYNYYVGKHMELSGGKSAGMIGEITDYVGAFQWDIRSGIVSVSIVHAGSGCQRGGFLVASSPNGTGFNASFNVLYSIPSVVIQSGGVDCAASVAEGNQGSFSIAAVDSKGTVTSLDFVSSAVVGSGYVSGPAWISCELPCEGSGLTVQCTASAGDITATSIVNGGAGYSLSHKPTIRCPEGNVEVVSVQEGPFDQVSVIQGVVRSIQPTTHGEFLTGTYYIDGPAIVVCNESCGGDGLRAHCFTDGFGDVTRIQVQDGGHGYNQASIPTVTCPRQEQGSGFLAYYYSNGSALSNVMVVDPGAGYVYPFTFLKVSPGPQQNPSCWNILLEPSLSGYLSSVTILNPGEGYQDSVGFTISHGGEGCQDFFLFGVVGDSTPGRLVENSTDASHVSLWGTDASAVDGYYNGYTLVMLSGENAGHAVGIQQYEADSKLLTLATGLQHTPLQGDAYAITKTPSNVIIDRARSVDFLNSSYGSLSSSLSCECAGTSYNSSSLCMASTSACSSGQCVCSVGLGPRAPAADGWFEGELIHFIGTSYRARVVRYDGATRTATLSVNGSAYRDSHEVPSWANIASGAEYLLSSKYAARVQVIGNSSENIEPLNSSSTYRISYLDFTEAERAFANSRPFFCQQSVGESSSLLLPFRRVFAFQSLPTVCSAATLTAQIHILENLDMFYPWCNIAVKGEQGETLGVLFDKDEQSRSVDKLQGAIVLSQDEMIAMSSDEVMYFTLETSPNCTGRLQIQSLTLAFNPSSCVSVAIPGNVFEQPSDLSYNVSFPVPQGVPVLSDGHIKVTAEANRMEGSIGVYYNDTLLSTLFTSVEPSSGTKFFAISQPADIAELCLGVGLYPNRSCYRSAFTLIDKNRSASHTEMFNISRDLLRQALANSSSLSLNFKISQRSPVRFNPLKLTYASGNARMLQLDESSGMGFGSRLYRPSKFHFTFQGDAPPAAGDALLWVHAYLEDKGYRQAESFTSQDTKLNTLTDPQPYLFAGREPFYVQLLRSRDPRAEWKQQQSRWPFLNAVRLRAGNDGEEIGWLFAGDYSQYEPSKGFVTSISIPLAIMRQFALKRSVDLTMEVPPGNTAIIVHSVVLTYPQRV